MDSVQLIFCNFPDRASAERAARAVVEGGCAACVNLLPACSSVYRWQGAVETAQEVPLLIKTTAAAYPELEQTLRALHPYQVPEIIALPVVAGLPAYLDWVRASVGGDHE